MLSFQTCPHVRGREMFLFLPGVHWQKVANQTCVLRLTKKLMASHISRRARKPVTEKASDHWQKVVDQTCVSKLTKKLMASHISRRARKPVTEKASDHWQKVADQTCVSRLTKKLMASHLSIRATATDRLLVEVVLIDPVSVGYSVKSDGTPDLRHAVNKSFMWYFVLVRGIKLQLQIACS